MCAQYRWAYATSTLLPLQEIGQNQHEKGGGLIIRHGRIIHILRYKKSGKISTKKGVGL